MNPLTTRIDTGGIWHISIFVALVICTLICVRKLPIQVSAIWTYVICQALYLIEYPAQHFGNMTRAFQASAGQTLAQVILIPVAVILKPDLIKKLIPPLVVVELICVWFRNGGLFVAESLDLAFLALCIPLLGTWFRVAAILTVFTHHGGTAQLIVAAQLFALALKSRYKTPMLVGIAICGAALLFHSRGPMLDSSERIIVYKHMMRIWAEDWQNIFMGVGAGTFMWVSVLAKPTNYDFWLALHSDWLQILWEYGVIGLALTLLFVSKAVKVSWGSPGRLAAIFGACAFGLTYHPLRFAPSALVIALIFVRGMQWDCGRILKK